MFEFSFVFKITILKSNIGLKIGSICVIFIIYIFVAKDFTFEIAVFEVNRNFYNTSIFFMASKGRIDLAHIFQFGEIKATNNDFIYIFNFLTGIDLINYFIGTNSLTGHYK